MKNIINACLKKLFFLCLVLLLGYQKIIAMEPSFFSTGDDSQQAAHRPMSCKLWNPFFYADGIPRPSPVHQHYVTSVYHTPIYIHEDVVAVSRKMLFPFHVDPVYLSFEHHPELFDTEETKGITFNHIKHQLAAFQADKQLIYLNLSHNNLDSLPEDLFEGITTIVVLDISYNNLERLPQTRYFLGAMLTGLDISHNRIFSWDELSTLPELRRLDVSGNLLDPSHFDRTVFPQLQTFSVDRKSAPMRVTPQPVHILNLAHQKELFASEDRKAMTFFRLHQQIANLQARGHLVDLNLADNDLYSIPEDFFEKLSNIVVLDISHNHLIKVPRTIAGHLRTLNISHNALTSLYEPIPRLPELRHLDASYNQIQALFLTPDLLPHIERLNVSHNCLVLTQELDQLLQFAATTSQAVFIDISDNPLTLPQSSC